MPKMTCKCGTVLNDDDPLTTDTLLAFTSADWERREAEADWRKQVPYSYVVWSCKTCGRWYLFGMGSDAPAKVLRPEPTED